MSLFLLSSALFVFVGLCFSVYLPISSLEDSKMQKTVFLSGYFSPTCACSQTEKVSDKYLLGEWMKECVLLIFQCSVSFTCSFFIIAWEKEKKI